MKIVTVPGDMCPLGVLAQMGEETKDYRLFFDRDCFEQLKRSVHKFDYMKGVFTFYWNQTKDRPKTKLSLKKEGKFFEFISIDSENIAFKTTPKHPLAFIFLKKRY